MNGRATINGNMAKKYRVGILGATGAVGQKFIEILDQHPWIDVKAVVASERSAAKAYKDAVKWISSSPCPADIAEMTVLSAGPQLDCDFVFSGLDARVAGEIESDFARAGYPVISNAGFHRMRDDIPLLIPEVNPTHASLVNAQQWDSEGFIVTNPNCSTVGLVCALRPLVDAFGVEAVQVTTLQALSGAGFPGVPSLEILGNVVPFINGEEAKLAAEPRKLLGTLQDGRIEPLDLTISAQCNRVPVLNGHLECVSVKIRRKAGVEAVREALKAFKSPISDLCLPSAPAHFLKVFDDENSPQPRLHASLGSGMTVSIGRIRPCEVLDVKFVVVLQNTIRGAAGGAVLNAELLIKQGYLKHRVLKEDG